jgi:hypothetical protein
VGEWVCVYGDRKGGREGGEGREGGRDAKAQIQRTLVVGVGPIGEDLQKRQGGLVLRAPQLCVW